MVPPRPIGTSIQCTAVRPSNVSDPMAFNGFARSVVFSAVPLLVLEETTLDSVASALQSGLCRFQSYGADNSESGSLEEQKSSIPSSGTPSSSTRV